MSSRSRTNGRPARRVSLIPALDLEIPESGDPWVVCGDCGRWAEVTHGLVQTHKHAGLRCRGSAQLVDFDLTSAQHTARRIVARAALSAPADRRERRALVEPDVVGVARFAAVRGAQHAAEVRMRTTQARTRTSMAEAFDAAWSKISQVPTAGAVHRIAAGRA